MLPAGSLLGSALLLIETQKKTILYAPHMQTVPLPHVKPLQLKKADTLIIGTHHANPDTPPPAREEEKLRLIDKILHSNERVKIFCSSIGTAQEITELVASHRIPVAVHPNISSVNRVYMSFAIKLGNFSIFSKKRSKWQVLILPYAKINCNRTRQICGLNFHIHDTYPPPSSQRPPHADFYLSRTCNGSDLKAIVAKVRPKEIFTFGNYAKKYREEFQSFCPQVKPLFAGHQPTLF